jgi:integrase
MIPAPSQNGPAALQRPGPGTEERSFDADPTLRDEAGEMSSHVPIEGHPGFYRRNGRVCFRFRDRRGRQRWDSAQTIKEALRKKVQRQLEVERGEHQAGSRKRFDDYALLWIDTYAGRTARGISETTRDDYRRRLEKEAIPYFGKMRLSEIEPRDLKEYARSLEAEGKAPNTVRLAVAPVRALLATAVEEGLLRANPAAGLRIAQRRPETEEVEQAKAMTEDELSALLTEVGKRAQRWWLFFAFLAWSGLRIGEAIELRWKDVDLGQRIVHVRRRFFDNRIGPPKTKYGNRRLRLTPELARALWRVRGSASDEDLVFVNGSGGRIHASDLMRRVLKPAAVEAGLGAWAREGRKLRAESWVGFHSFRHTCATLLFRNGWNAVQVQRWLGHHKPSFTLDTYVHLLDEDVPEPSFFDRLATTPCDTLATQAARDQPRPDAEAGDEAKRFPPPNRVLPPTEPRSAEASGTNF